MKDLHDQNDSPLDLVATAMENKADPAMMDFGEDFLLHVECGPNQAKLYLNRLKMGSRGACVVFNGAWLTPNQFQAVSGRKTAKDWKRSIKHYGKSLKLLLAKGTLTIEPAECRCENCTGEPHEETSDLVTQQNMGSDEENVPPSKEVLLYDTPLSPHIAPPSGDISDGREYGGAAGEIFNRECHMDRDKRSSPTWNVLSAKAADSCGEADEKSGGCSSSPPTTPGGDKFGHEGTSPFSINGKFSTVAESQVNPAGIHGEASLNHRPAAPAGSNEAHSPRSESPASPAVSAPASHPRLEVTSETNHRRMTSSPDRSRQPSVRPHLHHQEKQDSSLHSPSHDRAATPNKSPKKAARLTSIIEGLKKNKQENAVGSSSEGDIYKLSSSTRSPEIEVERPSSKPRKTKKKSRSSSSSINSVDKLHVTPGSSAPSAGYSGALSLALLSNPIYLQSVYPYGIPKEHASMIAAQMDYRQKYISSQYLLQENTKQSNKEKSQARRRSGEHMPENTLNHISGSKSSAQSKMGNNCGEKYSAEHLKYDKHGALDLSVRKRDSDTTDGETNQEKGVKRPRSDTLHYFPSPPHSPAKGEDGPLQCLEKLQVKTD